MKKKIIDWEAAARDKVPCYFWFGKRPEKPDVSRLVDYLGGNGKNKYETRSYRYEHCELVRTEDKEKYTKTIWEGRDNFIAAIKKGVEMKVKVTPEISVELQEIAFQNGYIWAASIESIKNIKHLDQQGLHFRESKKIGYWSMINDSFFEDVAIEYYPETDSFEQPKPNYRPCENFEELRPFWGKTAKLKDDNLYSIISDVDFGNTESDLSFIWFHDWELIEPINGSKTIGVKQSS